MGVMRKLPALDPDQADLLLSPFKALFVSEIRGAFSDWTALLARNPDETSGLTSRTQTTYIHERIVYRLSKAEVSSKFPGLRVRKQRGLVLIIVKDQLALKIKKVNRKLRSRNIRTLQTARFDNQEQLIAGMPSLTNATLGHVLDEAAAEPIHIVAVCWEGDHQHWAIRLDESEGLVVELSVEPVGPPKPETGTRVVATDESAKDEPKKTASTPE